jgi:hypothetical protein
MRKYPTMKHLCWLVTCYLQAGTQPSSLSLLFPLQDGKCTNSFQQGTELAMDSIQGFNAGPNSQRKEFVGEKPYFRATIHQHLESPCCSNIFPHSATHRLRPSGGQTCCNRPLRLEHVGLGSHHTMVHLTTSLSINDTFNSHVVASSYDCVWHFTLLSSDVAPASPRSISDRTFLSIFRRMLRCCNQNPQTQFPIGPYQRYHICSALYSSNNTSWSRKGSPLPKQFHRLFLKPKPAIILVVLSIERVYFATALRLIFIFLIFFLQCVLKHTYTKRVVPSLSPSCIRLGRVD